MPLVPASPPPPGLDLSGLVLVGSTTCQPCAANAEWLDRQGVVFRKVQIDDAGRLDEALCAWLTSVTQQQRVPQFFLDGAWISGGASELAEMLAAGQLPLWM